MSSRRTSKRGREAEAEEGPKRNKAVAEAATPASSRNKGKRGAKSDAGPHGEDSASKRSRQQKHAVVEDEEIDQEQQQQQQSTAGAPRGAFAAADDQQPNTKWSGNTGDIRKSAFAAAAESGDAPRQQIQSFIHSAHDNNRLRGGGAAPDSPPAKHTMRRYMSHNANISTVTPPALQLGGHGNAPNEPWVVGRSNGASYASSPLGRSPRRSPRKSPRRRQADVESQKQQEVTPTTDGFAVFGFIIALLVVGYNLLQLQELMHERRGHGQFAETTYVTGLLTQLLWEPVYADQYHQHLPTLMTLEELLEPQNVVQMLLVPALCGVAGFAAVSMIGAAMITPIVYLLSYVPLVIILAAGTLCLAWQHFLLAAAAGFALAVYWTILPTIRKTVGRSLSLWHEAVSSRYLFAYPLHLLHMAVTDAFLIWLLWSSKEIVSVVTVNAMQPKTARYATAGMTKAFVMLALMVMWVHFSFRGCAQIAIARSTKVMQQGANKNPAGSLVHTYRYHLGSACFGGLFMTTAATIRFIRTTTDLSRDKLQKVASLIPWWMVPALPVKLAINVTAAILWTVVQLLSALGFYLERFVPLRYAYVGVYGVPLLFGPHDTSIGSPVMTMTFTQDMLMVAITVLATTVGQMFLAALLFGQVVRRVQVYSVLYAVYLCAFVTRATMLSLLAIDPPQNFENIDKLMDDILKQ